VQNGLILAAAMAIAAAMATGTLLAADIATAPLMVTGTHMEAAMVMEAAMEPDSTCLMALETAMNAQGIVMSFQNNDSKRLPRPKNVKIRNSPRLQQYRRDNPHCELCRLELAITPASEVHHIYSQGRGGGDELWNIIHLCHNHHVNCTEHVVGADSVRNNMVCLALKAAKGEVPQRVLQTLDLIFLDWDNRAFQAARLEAANLYDLANRVL
jgi:hypothetical protein